ncbi:TetR/AcrR family transcriptional regulator [Sphingobium chlorophenolicum]|nr:TetR/AcrR family transcriptional regulator [Sphingobium chlorophenolicum]
MMNARPEARRRGRPTADESQMREQAIMEAAAALFEQQGFAGVTMAEVARRARISKTTLYARYPDKPTLFRAICSYACRVPAHRFAEVATKGREPEDVLADFAVAIVEATADPAADRFLRLAIFEARRFPELAEQILLESRAVAAPLIVWLEGLARDGRLSGHDPALLARQFGALVTGGHDGLLQCSAQESGKRIAAATALFRPLFRPQ